MQASGYNFFVWQSTRFLPGLICISIVEEMLVCWASFLFGKQQMSSLVCWASFLFSMIIKQQMSLLVCWASFLFSMIIKQQMSLLVCWSSFLLIIKQQISLNIKGQQANLFQHLSS